MAARTTEQIIKAVQASVFSQEQKLSTLIDEGEKALVKAAIDAERRVLKQLEKLLPQFSQAKVGTDKAFRIENTSGNINLAAKIYSVVLDQLEPFSDDATKLATDLMTKSYQIGASATVDAHNVMAERPIGFTFNEQDAMVLKVALTKGYGKEQQGAGKIKGITQDTADAIRDIIIRGIVERRTPTELMSQLYQPQVGLTSLVTFDANGVKRTLSVQDRAKLIARNEPAAIYQIAATEKARDIFGDDPWWYYGSVYEPERMTDWCKARYGRVAKVSQWNDPDWVKAQFGDGRTGTGHIHINCRQSGHAVSPDWFSAADWKAMAGNGVPAKHVMVGVDKKAWETDPAKKVAESNVFDDAPKIKIRPVRPKKKKVGVSPPEAAMPDATGEPEPLQFTLVGKAEIGGAHTKYFLDDQHGERWLFKPVHEEFRAYGDIAADLVQMGIGLPSPGFVHELVEITIGGQKHVGSVQRWTKDVVKSSLGADVTAYPSEYYERLQKEHVLDWLIGNHDGHERQFLVLKDGSIVGVDKGQTMKFFGKDALDTSYQPNSGFGENSVYNQMWDAAAAGRLTLDPQATLTFIDEIQARFSDDDFKDAYRRYAESRLAQFRSLPLPGGKSTANVEVWLEAIAERKRNLRRDFEAFFTKLGILKTAYMPITAEVMKKIETAGWQGFSVPTDGEDLEDLQALFLVAEMAGGGKALRLHAKVRLGSENRLLQTIQQPAALQPSTPKPLAADVYWNDLLAAIKTVNVHVTDKQFNQVTLQAAFAHKPSLQKLAQGIGDEKKMAQAYLKVLDSIEAAMAAGMMTPKFDQYLQAPPPAAPSAAATGKLQVIDQRPLTDEGIMLQNGQLVVGGKETPRLPGGQGEEWLIDLGDGVIAKYRPHHDDNPASVRGQLELETRFSGSPQEAMRLVEKLGALGLDSRLADETNLEVAYLARNAWMLKVDLQSGWQAIVQDSTLSATEKRDRMKTYLANELGIQSLDGMKEYDFRPRYDSAYNPSAQAQGVDEGGKFYWNNFVVTESWLKNQKLHFQHAVQMDLVDFFGRVLGDTGHALSTEERWRIGVRVQGMSSIADMYSGGANYLFTRPNTGNTGNIGGTLIFSKEMIRRSDHFGHDRDRYGVALPKDLGARTTYQGVAISSLHGGIEERVLPTDYPSGRVNEVMFKNGINLLDYLTRVNARSDRERDALIQLFHSHGITRLGGKPVADSIKVGR